MRLDLERIKRAERLAVVTGVALVATTLIVVGVVGGKEALEQARKVSFPLLLSLLSLSLLNYVLRALRWHLCSRALGLDVPLARSVLYYIAGFSMTTTPGKVGEVLRLWLLRKDNGYGFDRTSALLVADRLFDAMALVLLTLVSIEAFTDYLTSIIVAGLAVLLATILFLRPQLLIGGINFAYSMFPVSTPRLFARLRRAARQLQLLGSFQLVTVALVLSVLGWLCEAYALLLLLEVFDVRISPSHTVFVFAFSTLVGALLLLPGGVGGVEATMVALLVALGSPLSVAVTVTAILRLTTLWFAVVLGLLALGPALHRARAKN